MHARNFVVFAIVVSLFMGIRNESLAQSAGGHGAGSSADSAIRNDTSRVVPRVAVEGDFARFAADPDFDYERERSQANTFWQKLYVWLFGNLLKALASAPLRPVWKILPYLIMGAALYLLVSWLLKSQAQGLFSPAETGAALDFQATREDLLRTDFRKRIDGAIREKKYRQAIRLLYLSSLKQLAQAGAIQWHLDKTNYDYVGELVGSHMSEPFAELTRLFEYIWYGEFALNQAAFEAAHHKFRGFQQLLEQDWQATAAGRK